MSEFDYLRDKLRRLREQNPADLNLRCHRAVTWLCRSDDLVADDPDAAFIFGWIAFNAAYARDIGNDPTAPERRVFQDFFTALVAADPKGRIAHELWCQHEGLITRLLDNPFIFNPFWRFHNGDTEDADWAERFAKAKDVAREAIERENAAHLLSILFDRLYVLRNQLMHGGTTWGSRVNRAQMRDGVEVLHCLLPVFVDTMISAPDRDWGIAHYPVIEDPPVTDIP
ncbi:HEPN domain-containing protein (plasmid) [Thioclava litoralis]|uniref:HEPN domain-containing protein n=1 Tax=Thioclava litoralis TaxID=3076557 RepID=A0ABZ1E614_9RHOB|nr:HEPN domain-containing protein [Thioclava sp. FTW29]